MAGRQQLRWTPPSTMRALTCTSSAADSRLVLPGTRTVRAGGTVQIRVHVQRRQDEMAAWGRRTGVANHRAPSQRPNGPQKPETGPSGPDRLRRETPRCQG